MQLIKHKKNTTYNVGNLGPGFGQVQRCGWVKSVCMCHTLIANYYLFSVGDGTLDTDGEPRNWCRGNFHDAIQVSDGRRERKKEHKKKGIFTLKRK